MYKPIVPWLGGKRRLAKHILPMLPTHTCYVEPFCGAAAILFAKQPAEVEVLNDINGELVNLYRIVQHHLEEFIRQFKHALISRQLYDWLKETPPHVLTDIQRAARFYYLQKMAFGGKIAGQNFGVSSTSPPRLNLLRFEEELSMAHLRLSRCYIEHLEWHDCVEKYDGKNTLFYLDPPYWATEGYGVEFDLEQYDRIAAYARSIKGRMIISVNDIPEMRHAFDGLPMDTIGIKYSVGSNSGELNTTGELIIRSSQEGFNGQSKLI